MPAEEIVNWMLAEARYCMGAKVGSQAGLQTYDMFVSTCLQIMICLQADQQGLQGLQIYDMFASMWLANISYVCKPCKTTPFLSVGVGPLHHAQIGIHMIQLG